MDHATPQVGAPTRTFTQLLSSTRRGARLARLLTVTELRLWGAPQDLTERAESVVAELAANAVLHGRLPGRCFRLTLVLTPSADRLRVKSPTRAETSSRTSLRRTPHSIRSDRAVAACLSSPPWPTTGTPSPTRPAARPSGPS